MKEKKPTTFLTAEWRNLAMANYAIEPHLLSPYLPYKTELDFFNSRCYVSLVGFLFQNTKVRGLSIPFHKTFEEVNLRFYVRFKAGNEWKRGVVFIKEIVPKAAITFVANTIYKENYQTLPMKHSWVSSADELSVEYSWKLKNWHNFRVIAKNEAKIIEEGSEEEFITEHYWGYTKTGKEKSSEYEVVHPRWLVYDVKNYKVEADLGLLYGNAFSFLNQQKPDSVLLAEGSEVKVQSGLSIS